LYSVHIAAQNKSNAKFALIVGVTAYEQSTKWSNLSTIQDIEMMKNSIISRGFNAENVHILAEKTQKEDILRAFREHLINNATPGGVYFFHFSGHGYQIPDNNNDELDGWDEAIVPSNAPKDNGKIHPESFYVNYIRDDELQELLDELRTKIGPTGNVMVSIDACHSGTATRGVGPYRGEQRSNQTNINQVTENADFGLSSNKANMAPLTCFFASSENQLNREYHQDDIKCGSLSFALSKALNETDSHVSYTALFDRVKKTMNNIVPGQNPHLEGEQNQEIFGGKLLEKVTYFRVEKSMSSTKVEINAGLLASVTEGSIVGFYAQDTRDYLKATPLVKGKVLQASILSAEVELIGAFSDLEKLNLSWVYLLDKNMSGRVLKLHILSSSNDLQLSAVQKLKDYPFVEISSNLSQSDMLLEIGIFKNTKSDTIYLTNKEDLICLKIPLSNKKSINTDEFEKIIESIISYDQVSLLRSLEIENSDLSADIRIIPYKLKPGARGTRPEDYQELDSTFIYKNGSKIPEIPVGTFVRFEVLNKSPFSIYYSILDITPLNELSILAPNNVRSAQEYKIGNGGSQIIPGIFKIVEPYGDDLLKLIISNKALDLAGIKETKGVGTRGGNSSMEELLRNTFRGSEKTRGPDQVVMSIEDVGIYSFYYRIYKNIEQ
jgi:hypothetical protein